jgi:hypothetical protein
MTPPGRPTTGTAVPLVPGHRRDAGVHQPRAVWRPLRQGDRIVDFVLQEVDDDAALLGLPVDGAGQRMTRLFPDTVGIGRLAAFRAVAETGRPFRFSRPSTPARAEVSFTVSRSPSGDVVAEVEPPDVRPTSSREAGTRAAGSGCSRTPRSARAS